VRGSPQPFQTTLSTVYYVHIGRQINVNMYVDGIQIKIYSSKLSVYTVSHSLQISIMHVPQNITLEIPVYNISFKK